MNRLLVAFLFFIVIDFQAYADAPSQESPRIATVSEAVAKMVENKEISGAVVLVSDNGSIVHFDAQGFRDVDEALPMQKDTIFRIYSMTKPVTTVAAMMLVEEGKLALDEPVETYLPELKGIKVQKGRKRVTPQRKMTIRDLMRHTSGMTYGFFSNTPVDKLYMKSHPLYSRDNAELVEKLSGMPLLHHPGVKWHYSIATDVLGAVVERVSGKTLGDFFEQEIFSPLGMDDTGFHVPADQVERFASNYSPGVKLKDKYSQSRYLDSERIQSGGGGLVSTAEDYLAFSEMLRNMGEHNGTRLLEEKTVKDMTRNQLPKGVKAYGLFGFGLGFLVQLDDWGHKAHKGEYGWDGAASTHFWISPSDDLVVIALSQRQPFSNTLKQSIKPLLYKALEG